MAKMLINNLMDWAEFALACDLIHVGADVQGWVGTGVYMAEADTGRGPKAPTTACELQPSGSLRSEPINLGARIKD